MRNFPNLISLIYATFNQDWMLHQPDWKACLRDELSRGAEPWKHDLKEEIQTIEMVFSDTEIEGFFLGNRAEIEPPYHAGLAHRAWLQEVQRLIDDDLSSP